MTNHTTTQSYIGQTGVLHYFFTEYHPDDPSCIEDVFSYKVVVVEQTANDCIAIQHIDDTTNRSIWFTLQNNEWVSKKSGAHEHCRLVLKLI